MGKHSGTYKGVKYFECENMKGMLVKLDRIRRKLPGDPATMGAHKWKSLGTSNLEAKAKSESQELLNVMESEQELNDLDYVERMDYAAVKTLLFKHMHKF